MSGKSVSSITAPIDAEDLKREERRAIFLLGVLAVVAAMRFGARDTDVFQYEGLSRPLIPFLNLLILGWFAYAACMLVFFSDDLLKGKPGNAVRRLARIAGLTLAVTVPALLVWVVSSLGSVLKLPSPFTAVLFALPILAPLVYILATLYHWIWKHGPS